MLLIGSMAYSKAYKTNKFLLDSVVNYADLCEDKLGKDNFKNDKMISTSIGVINSDVLWNNSVNDYLSKAGYILSNSKNSCPAGENGYENIRDTKVGDYDYCIYRKRLYELSAGDDQFTKKRYSYKVLSYMKLDFPVVGDFIKLPIVSESKVIIKFH
jgi:hypothetical protein